MAKHFLSVALATPAQWPAEGNLPLGQGEHRLKPVLLNTAFGLVVAVAGAG